VMASAPLFALTLLVFSSQWLSCTSAAGGVAGDERREFLQAGGGGGAAGE